mgnify:FL=1
MNKVFVTGDRVLVRGKIPGCDKADSGQMKSGIVAGMDYEPNSGTYFVDVLLDTPIKGVAEGLMYKAGPWAFLPEDLKRV